MKRIVVVKDLAIPVLIGLASVIYIVRYGMLYLNEVSRLPFAITLCFFAPIAAIVIIIAGLSFLTFTILNWHNPLVLIVSAIGALVLIAFPHPQLPPFPEETHFLENRQAYESVISAIRDGELCDEIATDQQCELPPEYSHLSQTELQVSRSSDSELYVTFHPFEPLYALVFGDDPGTLRGYVACDGSGRIDRNIDENWVLCTHWGR